MASVEMVGRLLVSLAVVLGLMWLIARKLRGGAAGKGRLGRATKVVEVLDRVSLSRSASVAVVRVNGEALVLGVAEHGVTILGSTDLAAAQAARSSAKAKPSRTTTQAPSAARAAAAQAVLARAAANSAAAPAGNQAAPPATGDTIPDAPAGRGALAGSALSPQTWRQTIDSLRDLTART